MCSRLAALDMLICPRVNNWSNTAYDKEHPAVMATVTNGIVVVASLRIAKSVSAISVSAALPVRRNRPVTSQLLMRSRLATGQVHH
jgi:hypothetical protein